MGPDTWWISKAAHIKENETYVNGLADGDLKHFLQNECKSETLVTILRVGQFQTMVSIGKALPTSKELKAAAKEAGINVGLVDGGSIELLYQKLEFQSANGMYVCKINHFVCLFLCVYRKTNIYTFYPFVCLYLFWCKC